MTLTRAEAEAFDPGAYLTSARTLTTTATALSDAARASDSASGESATGWLGLAGQAFRASNGTLHGDLGAEARQHERLAGLVFWYGDAMGRACSQATGLARTIEGRGFLVDDRWQVRLAPAQTAGLDVGFRTVEAAVWQGMLTASVGVITRIDDQADDTAKNPSAPLPGSPTGEQSSQGYTLGPPIKRNYHYDDMFPFGSKRGEDTWGDRASWLKWEAMLRGSQAVRVDLDDANPMYEHFRGGSGEPVRFDYEEAYREDDAVRRHIDDEIARAQGAAQEFINSGHTDFEFSSPDNPMTGQPSTDNWRKTIGAHNSWSESRVRVDGDTVTMTITVKAEDRWNFNRDMSDVSSGASDNDNGRFEELGWARSFQTSGEVQRTITWNVNDPPPSSVAGPEAPGGPRWGEPVGGGREEGGMREDRQEPEEGSRWKDPLNKEGSKTPPPMKR